MPRGRRRKSVAVDEDELEDIELMNDILESIDEFKKDSTENVKEKKSKEKVKMDSDGDSSARLSQTLALLGQALEYANALQNMLLMKEVKLLSMKRQLTLKREKEAALMTTSSKDEDSRYDIGRFIVRFKAPYFKDSKDFAVYVVVPESALPITSLKYEHQAVEWTKPDLKELERLVKKTLAAKNFHSFMVKNNPSTYEEKKGAVDKYNYMKNKAHLSALVNSDFEHVIDWCRIASNMRKNHSPHECQKAWNIYLKPTLNKKKWSPSEKDKLTKVALEYNYEDWDAIADQLGTNRSGYQCFHQHQDLMNKVSEGEWSAAEEELLKRIVLECTYGSKVLWLKVAYYFEFRSLPQIYRKWTLSNVRMNHKVGAFSAEDDQVILKAMLNGANNVDWAAHHLNRTVKQIRYRFSQLKNSLTTKYGAWTLEEDEKLMALVETHGTKNWATIAKFIPNRKRVQIRHRYVHIKKRLENDPETQLEQLKRPKRTVYQARKLNTVKCVVEWAKKHDDKTENISEELDQLLIEDGNPDDWGDLSDDGVKNIIKRRRGRPTKKDQKLKVRMDFDDDKTDKTPYSENILWFYDKMSKYVGEPIRPINSYDGTDEVKPANSLLKFEPYKYFNHDDAEWWYKLDKLDPYYVEASKFKEGRQIRYPSGSSKGNNWIFPPSLTTFEALHNLLVDIDFNETDLLNEDLDEQLSNFYDGQDLETLGAVAKWKNRIKTLFFWPAVLSAIDLEERTEEGAEVEDHPLVVINNSTVIDEPSSSTAIEETDESKKEIGLSIHVGDNSERVAKLMMHEDNGVIFIKTEEPLNSSFEASDVFDLNNFIVDQPDT